MGARGLGSISVGEPILDKGLMGFQAAVGVAVSQTDDAASVVSDPPKANSCEDILTNCFFRRP